jgi:nitrite reductase/ring-hydroxylating ferredoxin subunit
MAERIRVGTIGELEARGCLTFKVGPQPICVLASEGRLYAVDDRCPHMGFPLHRGTAENGLLTCHWHHARFDLESGGTLDPFADDVRAYPVELDAGDVLVVVEPPSDQVSHLLHRLAEGLEHGLTLVQAKAVLGLFDALGPAEATAAVVRAGVDFGTRYREAGFGAGLTVLTAMANVLPALDPTERPLALVHGLAFVSRDTRGHAPRFALQPLEARLGEERVGGWYRRFVDTRSGDAAERAVASAVTSGLDPCQLAAMMGAAATDHVFMDEGHLVDFTNKAFEVLDHLGWEQASAVLPTLAQVAAAASRQEESSPWRHPHDLAGLLEGAEARLQGRSGRQGLVPGPGARPAPDPATLQQRGFGGDQEVDELAWRVLGEDPSQIVAALDQALDRGATAEEVARAVAYAAALRMTRFHTQNDHQDWDVVHHGFTSANAVHQLIARAPTLELVRGVYQGAMKVFLDRFLNVPAARVATRSQGADLGALQACWDRQGMVDEAGAIVYAWIRSGGGRDAAVAALGRALLREDAEFHWFQTYEAAVRQSAAWPEGSEQAALILAGTARFLAAHSPTRRELAQVVSIARRLRRGEQLYDPDDELPVDAGATR